MSRKLVLTVAFVLCLSFTMIEAEGHNPGYVINVTCGRAPVVDGALLYDEWSDASTVSFNNTLVYLKHDGSSLYMGFNVSDATLDLDKEGVLAYMDINHEGGSETQADDIGFGVFRNGTAFELRYPNAFPPTGGWTVAVHEAAGFYTAEFNITYAKVGLAPDINKTLGLLLNSYDYSTLQNCFWPPLTQSEAFIPSNWGDLTSDDRWKSVTEWTGTVYIRADGSIDPPDAPITTLDNITYTLTGNITSEADGIVIERNNIIIEGAGYTLRGTGKLLSHGIDMSYRTNVTIKNINIKGFDDGIYLVSSSNNTITENNITTNNGNGISLRYHSSNNIISGNSITANTFGIALSESSNNTISGNVVAANSDDGVQLFWSPNNTISENDITSNNIGVDVYGSPSSNNTISGNSITVNSYGLWLYYSSNNTIFGNNILYNGEGIRLSDSSSNKIYHNDFVDNTVQVYVEAIEVEYGNVWGSGYPSGGNYWSDYNGTDQYSGPYQNEDGSDGLSDAPYEINENNTDRYPLMAPFSTFDAGTWNGAAYNVDVVSNSTVSDFHFNPDEGAFLRFNVTGEDGTVGFCRVTVPKGLLWVEDGWTVSVGGEQVNYTVIPDENHTYLYFTYSHSTKTVLIQGTHVIPEFPSGVATLEFLMLITIPLIFTKKKCYRRTKS